MERKLYVSIKVLENEKLRKQVMKDFNQRNIENDFANGLIKDYKVSIDDMQNINIVAIDEDFEDVSYFSNIANFED